MALVAAADGAAPGVAAPSRVPDPKRAQAERDVLRFLDQDLGQRWILRHPGGRRLFSRLYDRRTHLLQNSTQAVCRRSRNPHQSGRFYCVVRPARHRPREGLHVRYVRYGEVGRYFRIKWLVYRRG